MLLDQAVEQWLHAGAPYLREHERLEVAQPVFDRRGVDRNRLRSDSVGQRIMPGVTHRRQADLAGAFQHQEHATAHHIAQCAIGLAPLPGLTEPGG